MTIRERRFGVNPNEGAKEEAPFLLRNFGRTKSGKRVRSEDKRSGTNDSNEHKEISRQRNCICVYTQERTN